MFTKVFVRLQLQVIVPPPAEAGFVIVMLAVIFQVKLVPGFVPVGILIGVVLVIVLLPIATV